jgi:zinc protease
MKQCLPLLLSAVLLAGNSLVHAAPSADELIKEHVKALGGLEAAKKIKTRQVKGVIEIPMQNITADMTIFSKAPDKQRTEIDIPGMGKIVEGYDGKVAWSQNPWTGLMEKTGGPLKQAQQQAEFYRDFELDTRYTGWTLKGRETIDGKSTDVVEGKSKEGGVDVLYLDEKTHLLVQLKTEAETEQGKMSVVSKMSDYRDVDGLKLPHLVDVEAGPGGFKMTIKEIKQGVDLDDKLFAKPEK